MFQYSIVFINTMNKLPFILTFLNVVINKSSDALRVPVVLKAGFILSSKGTKPVRPNKKICLFPVTRPSLENGPDPSNFGLTC